MLHYQMSNYYSVIFKIIAKCEIDSNNNEIVFFFCTFRQLKMNVTRRIRLRFAECNFHCVLGLFDMRLFSKWNMKSKERRSTRAKYLGRYFKVRSGALLSRLLCMILPYRIINTIGKLHHWFIPIQSFVLTTFRFDHLHEIIPHAN